MVEYIRYLDKKRLIFFYSLGVEGLKYFIITDDKKTVQKILIGIEKMTQTDDKITFVNIKFSMKACKKLSNKEIENLSDTAKTLFKCLKL